jgi:hypothetical protein
MGRKRVWANDAERQRQVEGGTRDVRFRLSAEASTAIGIRHSRRADDLRPLTERLYTLGLLARTG